MTPIGNTTTPPSRAQFFEAIERLWPNPPSVEQLHQRLSSLDRTEPQLHLPGRGWWKWCGYPQPEGDDLQWLPTSHVVDGGGNQGGWGKFTYRPGSLSFILDALTNWDLDDDLVKFMTVGVVETQTPQGHLYGIDDDGNHRLAVIKGLGLPCLPAQIRGTYCFGPHQLLDRWDSPGAWPILLNRGAIVGKISQPHHQGTPGRARYFLRLETDSAVPWLAIDDDVVLQLAPIFDRIAPGWDRELGLPRGALESQSHWARMSTASGRATLRVQNWLRGARP